MKCYNNKKTRILLKFVNGMGLRYDKVNKQEVHAHMQIYALNNIAKLFNNYPYT